MAQDIIIRGVTYQGAEEVNIPLASGQGTAAFVDPSDATLSSGNQMLNGVKGIGANGTMYTGSIASRDESDLTASGATVTVPAGHYASQETKSVASGSATAPASISGTSASVTTGTNTLTLTKTVSVTPTVTAGYVSSGTAGNSSVSLTASVTTRGAATLQPGTSAVTLASGTYLTGAQTIPAEPNYIAANIVAGKSLWGLNGTAQIPVISYDTTTHILSIS